MYRKNYLKYKKTSAKKVDVYQEITDKVIEQLESGNAIWKKSWQGTSSLPFNVISKKKYSGINILLLTMFNNYSDPRWLSFKQAKDLGGKVIKGEKGTRIVWSGRMKKSDSEIQTIKNNNPDKELTEYQLTYWTQKFHTVFNVEQCEGLKLPELKIVKKSEFEILEEAQKIVDGMPNRPEINHDGNDRAFYNSASDSIHLPKQEAFDSNHEYYSTLFHELGHSTGHNSRLDREFEKANYHSDTSVRSREELTAEFTAMFIGGHCAIDNATMDNSTAYINSWASFIKKDKEAVLKCATEARKASKYILNESEETK